VADNLASLPRPLIRSNLFRSSPVIIASPSLHRVFDISDRAGIVPCAA
jgi:hypothetical protein